MPGVPMARYFIGLRDVNGMVRDEDGAEFTHLEEAPNEAKESARDVIRHYVDNRVPSTAICIEVRDDQCRIVATLTVAEVIEHPLYPEFKSSCAGILRAAQR
jgi:hypothetical protein